MENGLASTRRFPRRIRTIRPCFSLVKTAAAVVLRTAPRGQRTHAGLACELFPRIRKREPHCNSCQDTLNQRTTRRLRRDTRRAPKFEVAQEQHPQFLSRSKQPSFWRHCRIDAETIDIGTLCRERTRHQTPLEGCLKNLPIPCIAGLYRGRQLSTRETESDVEETTCPGWPLNETLEKLDTRVSASPSAFCPLCCSNVRDRAAQAESSSLPN
jgi:hypothetical protein